MTLRKTPQAPRAPSHLSSKSRALWKWVVENFQLEVHHLLLLQRLCEASDRCDDARELLAKEGIVTKDRFGRALPHPAIQIERDARIAVVRIARELDLDSTAPESRPPVLPRYK